jgi:ribosome-binding protein aMBF1 (putative translation factor)
VDTAIARLESQLQEYDELCSLRNHESDAPVSKEQLLMEMCRVCTARYHMVLEQAKSKNSRRPVRAIAKSDGGEDGVRMTLGSDWRDRVQQLAS